MLLTNSTDYVFVNYSQIVFTSSDYMYYRPKFSWSMVIPQSVYGIIGLYYYNDMTLFVFLIYLSLFKFSMIQYICEGDIPPFYCGIIIIMKLPKKEHTVRNFQMREQRRQYPDYQSMENFGHYQDIQE